MLKKEKEERMERDTKNRQSKERSIDRLLRPLIHTKKSIERKTSKNTIKRASFHAVWIFIKRTEESANKHIASANGRFLKICTRRTSFPCHEFTKKENKRNTRKILTNHQTSCIILVVRKNKRNLIFWRENFYV